MPKHSVVLKLVDTYVHELEVESETAAEAAAIGQSLLDAGFDFDNCLESSESTITVDGSDFCVVDGKLEKFADDEPTEVEYGLEFSFYIDTQAYSQRDKDMFTCGVEYHMIYMSIVNRVDWSQCIHTENESRVRLLCGKMGVPVFMRRECDTWTHCEINSSTLS